MLQAGGVHWRGQGLGGNGVEVEGLGGWRWRPDGSCRQEGCKVEGAGRGLGLVLWCCPPRPYRYCPHTDCRFCTWPSSWASVPSTSTRYRGSCRATRCVGWSGVTLSTCTCWRVTPRWGPWGPRVQVTSPASVSSSVTAPVGCRALCPDLCPRPQVAAPCLPRQHWESLGSPEGPPEQPWPLPVVVQLGKQLAEMMVQALEMPSCLASPRGSQVPIRVLYHVYSFRSFRQVGPAGPAQPGRGSPPGAALGAWGLGPAPGWGSGWWESPWGLAGALTPGAFVQVAP